MKAKERIKMVKAMEFIVRTVNNEDLMNPWFVVGVADGDIDDGDLDVHTEDEENLAYYIEDDEFAGLMMLFTRIMARADEDGGLYCDRVVSKGE